MDLDLEALLEPAIPTILEACSLTRLDLTGSQVSLQVPPQPRLLELRIAGTTAPPGEPRSLRFLAAAENLQVLELGHLGQAEPWLRRPLLALLRSCAPQLRRLQAKLPSRLLEAGLGGLFSTGTCLPKLQRLESLDLEPGALKPRSRWDRVFKAPLFRSKTLWPD